MNSAYNRPAADAEERKRRRLHTGQRLDPVHNLRVEPGQLSLLEAGEARVDPYREHVVPIESEIHVQQIPEGSHK